MATLTVQDAPVSGLADVSFVAAESGGDEASTGPGVFLLVSNGDTASHTVTVVTPGTVQGLSIEDPAVTVSAGEMSVIPLARGVFGQPASWTYDAVTSVTVAAVKLTG